MLNLLINKKIIKNLLNIVNALLLNLFRNKFYLFTQHQNYFTSLKYSKNLIGKEDETVIENFEKKFSLLVGSGSSVSYGAGRMGFYSLLKILKISKGDEIILTSGNCSVMINAILKLEATPIFSDISDYTLGSDVNEIKKKITSKTRVIVAQHNFGIPCKIDEIKEFCQLNKIFLLEDCALSLCSKFKGIKVGNFGDAALFSFDNSKPLPLFSGGIIYTKNNDLYHKLKQQQENIGVLNKKKQKVIFKKLLLDYKFNHPRHYRFLYMVNILTSLKIKFGLTSPYLDENYVAFPINESYEYPCKIPTFLAYLGIELIDKWGDIVKNRLANLRYLINLLTNSKYSNCIPKIYSDSNYNIIPLRLVLIDSSSLDLEELLSAIIDVKSSWFKNPIVSTKEELFSFKYKNKSCPKSEQIGSQIINLPIEYKLKELKDIL